MKKITQMIAAVFIMFSTATQVLAQMPTISDGTNEYWYMVKGNKATAWYWEVTTVSGTANAVGETTDAAITRAKLFKVTGTAGAYQIFSNLNGTSALGSANTNGETLVTIGGTPVNTWIFTASTAAPNFQLIAPASAPSRNLNSYDGGTPKKLSYWQTADSDIGNRFQFVPVTTIDVQTSLQTKITEAQTLLSSTTEGTQLLQFSAASRTALQNAISTAQGTLASSNMGALLDGVSTLATAITTYNNAANWSYCAPAAGAPIGTQRSISSGTILANDVTTNMPANLNYLAPAETLISVKRGQTITLTLSGATNTRWGMAYAFFDWNQDNAWTLDGVKNGTEQIAPAFTFTPDANGERYLVGSGDGTTPITNASITVTVPTTAVLGRTALRIKCDESTGYNNTDPSDPCSKIYTGSVYNYVLNILDSSTGIAGNNKPEYTISTNGGIITVNGVKDIDVYSVTGQKQNAKIKLNPGIYIVKFNEVTTKVQVR